MSGRRSTRARASRRVIAAVVLVLTAGPATTRGAPSDPSADPVERLRQAVRGAEASLAAGEPQMAESRYRRALYEGWLLIGSLRRMGGDLEGAAEALEEALVTVVDNRRARLALARLHAELGRWNESELLLRSLIADDQADQESRRLLVETLVDAGRVEEAVQELEQLHYLTPGDSRNAYFLATGYLRVGRLEAAEALLDELAAELPTPQTWILIGRTYRDVEQYDRARAAFRRALELDPSVRRAHYYLGTVDLLEQGTARLESAISHFAAELEVAPDDRMTHLYQGMALVEVRRYEEAVPGLERASELELVRVDALRFLGRSLLALGRMDEAIEVLRRGLTAAGWEAGVEPEPEALGEFEARQISGLHYSLAQALRQGGAGDEAGPHFDAAKRFQARSAESARESLDRYLADETAAAPLVEDGSSGAEGWADVDRQELLSVERSIATTLARTHLNLGVLKSRAERMPAAIGHFEAAAELDPTLPRLHYSLGAARFAAGRFGSAAVALERAYRDEPSDPGLRRMLALAWLNAEEYDQAAELLAGDTGRESDPQLQYAYGLALVRSGRASEAEEIFSRLLEEHEAWPALNVVLGQAYAQQGDFEAAIATLGRALELDPRVAEAHSTLGEIHLRRGELDLAERELRAELASHPGDERAAYTLATVLDLNQKPDEAATLLAALLERRPELAKARYLLGKILLGRGDLEDAAEQLEAAAGLSPADPMIQYQLGLAYRALGRADESRQAFEAFRSLKREEG